MTLIDYLKNGRTVTDCSSVLVKHVQPYDAVKPSNADTIVSRYFEKSGIPMPPGKKRGPVPQPCQRPFRKQYTAACYF